MRKIFFFIFFSTIAYGSAFAQKKHISQKTSTHNISQKTLTHKKRSTSLIKYGTASFYAKKFNGRRTANGEIYNSTKYTAACNVLALGTQIKVTNLRNKKSVIVRINDRMHPKNKRLVDLSRSAAQTIGYSGRGLARVKIEVLKN